MGLPQVKGTTVTSKVQVPPLPFAIAVKLSVWTVVGVPLPSSVSCTVPVVAKVPLPLKLYPFSVFVVMLQLHTVVTVASRVTVLEASRATPS